MDQYLGGEGDYLISAYLVVINIYEHKYQVLEGLAKKVMNSKSFVRWFANEVGQTPLMMQHQGEKIERPFKDHFSHIRLPMIKMRIPK